MKVVISKTPKLKNPILICAWPGMGQVAFRAAAFLKTNLAFKEFGQIQTPEFFNPAGVFIDNGQVYIPDVPVGKFYYWKGSQDLILFVSEAQPSLDNSFAYAKKVIETAKSLGVNLIFTFAAMPAPIQHTQEPNVWATATKKELLNSVKKLNVNIMPEGEISGLNGLVLGVAKEMGIDGYCLLAEVPIYTIQIENPKASLAALRVMSSIIKIAIDLSSLEQYAKQIDNEIDKLVEFLKGGGQSSSQPPIAEEDIEKMKKDLDLFTKLPESARKSIEKFFDDAKKDLSKAAVLKKELDRWNVYKDYEDKFLDLFRNKGKN